MSKSDWRTTATTIGGIVSVLLVAAGLFYTNDANRRQQQLGLDQQELALQGQVADRFTAAIDQLGQEDEKKQDKLSIRLGGIYALQRLMADSPQDEPAAVQVLCAFVRTHAPRPDLLPKTARPSPADVRAAVTVLSQRPHPSERALDFSDTQLGLDQAILSGANLVGAYLAGADLSGADLSHAGLSGADLSGADLTRAKLYGAYLTGADLSNADLTGLNLGGVGLYGADLTGADLTRAKLYGVTLPSPTLPARTCPAQTLPTLA